MTPLESPLFKPSDVIQGKTYPDDWGVVMQFHAESHRYLIIWKDTTLAKWFDQQTIEEFYHHKTLFL